MNTNFKHTTVGCSNRVFGMFLFNEIFVEQKINFEDFNTCMFRRRIWCLEEFS